MHCTVCSIIAFLSQPALGRLVTYGITPTKSARIVGIIYTLRVIDFGIVKGSTKHISHMTGYGMTKRQLMRYADRNVGAMCVLSSRYDQSNFFNFHFNFLILFILNRIRVIRAIKIHVIGKRKLSINLQRVYTDMVTNCFYSFNISHIFYFVGLQPLVL